MFLQALVDFLIVAFVIFLVIKAYNRMRKPAADTAPAEEVLLLREIRDALKK
jgi:large conductance mechanosensitive channel